MGCKPYSNFNLVGAAQVGKSGLTGMRMLHRLSGRLAIWPIDPLPERGSVVVEIYTTIAAIAGGRSASRSKIRHIDGPPVWWSSISIHGLPVYAGTSARAMGCFAHEKLDGFPSTGTVRHADRGKSRAPSRQRFRTGLRPAEGQTTFAQPEWVETGVPCPGARVRLRMAIHVVPATH
jgi:hypothetical protein